MGGNQTLLGKIVAVKRFSFVFFLPKLIYSLVPPVCFILKFLILLFPNSFLILFLIIILFIIHFLFYFLFNFWNCFIFLLKFKKYIHFIDIRKLMILLVVFQNFSHVVFQGMFDNTIASCLPPSSLFLILRWILRLTAVGRVAGMLLEWLVFSFNGSKRR